MLRKLRCGDRADLILWSCGTGGWDAQDGRAERGASATWVRTRSCPRIIRRGDPAADEQRFGEQRQFSRRRDEVNQTLGAAGGAAPGRCTSDGGSRSGGASGAGGPQPAPLARVFRSEIGSTPAAWVEATRLDAVRRLLDDGEVAEQVGSACGFNDVDTFRDTLPAAGRHQPSRVPPPPAWSCQDSHSFNKMRFCATAYILSLL